MFVSMPIQNGEYDDVIHYYWLTVERIWIR